MRRFTRRGFLRAGLGAAPLVAFAPAPAFLARAAAAGPGRGGRALVVVELPGGNDGLNTVVPYADEGYARARPKLRIDRDRLIRLDDSVGLHPALAPLAKAWEGGRLAVVQGVGYPNPSRSHFVSQAVWHTARPDPAAHRGVGWLGRGADAPGAAPAVYVGDGPVPLALRGRLRTAVSVGRPEDCRLDPALPRRGPAALVPAAPAGPLGGAARADGADGLLAAARQAALDAADATELFGPAAGEAPRAYPRTRLARELHLAAGALKAGLRASVYYLVHRGEDPSGGYDIHARQLPVHEGLLGELAGALRAFFDDLTAAGLADRVAVLCFSEFGRRVGENASGGTDHGTAGPVFLAGAPIRGGLVGPVPDLGNLEAGDLKVATDFRRVYATVLEDWLGVAAEGVLGGRHERLPLFRG